jgi:hypothetical protein
MVQSRKAINSMLDEMISLIPALLPENRYSARRYLEVNWERIVIVTSSLEAKWTSEFLEEKFKDYIQSEEDRVRQSLVNIKYKIEDADTLFLIAGPGCIEKVNPSGTFTETSSRELVL